MAKTINELLEEFNDPPFTAEDFARERMELIAEFRLKYALNNDEQINEAIRTYRLPCCNDLVERWISLMAFKPYIDEA